MKVLVMGAGVIGVTTSYYLAKAGLEVTVIDRQPGPGRETSFANAGEVSPGYASPWAGPGVPAKAVRWMLDQYGPLVVRPQADPAMWRWLVQMLRNCTAARYAVNKARMVGIAEYSRDCLRALRADIGISYDYFASSRSSTASAAMWRYYVSIMYPSKCWIGTDACAPNLDWPRYEALSLVDYVFLTMRPAIARCLRNVSKRLQRVLACASFMTRQSRRSMLPVGALPRSRRTRACFQPTNT
jgi:hypothetical protein